MSIIERLRKWMLSTVAHPAGLRNFGSVIYVIYDHPRDNPDYWVVRAWHVAEWMPGKYQAYAGPACLAHTLKEARAFYIPEGFYPAISDQIDGDAIQEVYL